MKKTYLKPDAEYIDLLPTDILTNGNGPIEGEMGMSDLPEDW